MSALLQTAGRNDGSSHFRHNEEGFSPTRLSIRRMPNRKRGVNVDFRAPVGIHNGVFPLRAVACGKQAPLARRINDRLHIGRQGNFKAHFPIRFRVDKAHFIGMKRLTVKQVRRAY